jgi:hypothetical protein
VIYLGVFPGALAYVAWAYVLGHGTAGRMSSFLYHCHGVWLWQKVPNMLSLIGGAVALAGVVSVSLWGKTTPAAIDAAASDNYRSPRGEEKSRRLFDRDGRDFGTGDVGFLLDTIYSPSETPG